jgi:membrane fusion protein, multidrug efflux system
VSFNNRIAARIRMVHVVSNSIDQNRKTEINIKEFTMKYYRLLRILPAAGLLFLLPVLNWSGCGKEQQTTAPPLEVKVMAAVQKNVPLYQEYVGQIFGAVDIEIRARVSGWLQGIHFTEGTEVKKGTLLYTIDQSELLQAVAETKARMAQAQTLLVRAQSDVARYQPLAAAGAVSQRDLETAVAEAGARQAEVDAARASMKVAEISLSYATMYAPITGLIGLSAARIGEFVGRAPNPIILNTISRMDSIRVRFSITEQDFLNFSRRFIEEGKDRQGRARKPLDLILSDGTRYPDKGIIVFGERQIDPATGTLLLEASFPNADRLLRPGQFARVRGVVEERPNAVVIPFKSLTELQGQYLAYLLGADNKVESRPVTIGPKVDQLVIIESGIQAGDKVLVEGIQKVRPGMVVAPTLVPLPADSTEGGK